jgi:hypothetical protein
MTNLTKKKNESAGEILKLAIAGASLSEIKKSLKGTSDEDLTIGFDCVLQYFKSLAEFNPEVERGKAYARLNMLFLNSIKIQDYKTSLGIQKEINKLLDLYKKQERDVTIEANTIDAILYDE